MSSNTQLLMDANWEHEQLCEKGLDTRLTHKEPGGTTTKIFGWTRPHGNRRHNITWLLAIVKEASAWRYNIYLQMFT